jgi:hypothetical protein
LSLSIVVSGCTDHLSDVVGLSRTKKAESNGLALGERFPDTSEAAAVGPIVERVSRSGAGFPRLVRCDGPGLVFKDEEGTGADRLMTPRLRAALHRLSPRVAGEWPELSLRVTEAWDDKGEHGANSLHYEGRAADLTTSDVDPRKLGRLARLAVEAGLDWVFYEDASHVHVSVRR